MKKDKQIIYLVVGVIAYEGETVLHAFINRQDAERKLNALDAGENFIYNHYEIQPIELT